MEIIKLIISNLGAMYFSVLIVGGLFTFGYLVLKGVPKDPKWYDREIEDKFWNNYEENTNEMLKSSNK